MGWKRRRLYALVGLAAIASALLVVLPAFGDTERDAVRLHLGTDFQRFEYGETTQGLTTTRCEINERTGPLMEMDRRTGLNSFGIGIKSGGAQGTPCGRVDSSETLELRVPSSGVLAGRTYDGMRLDLELKGNAWVVVELFNGSTQVGETFQLASGSSIGVSGFPSSGDTNPDGGYTATSTATAPAVTCAGLSDSGPDSGSNDNCLWTIEAGVTFNRIVMKAQVGEFSLEGSGDYGNDRNYDTLFYLANEDPTAADDTATTDEDTELENIDVLTNDDDPDGDTLEVVGVGPALDGNDDPVTTGSVELDSNGDVNYDPNGQFEALNVGDEATDSFVYTVSDGKGGTASATVTVTVTGVNDAPVAPDGNATTDEDTGVQITVGTDVDDTVLTTDCTGGSGSWSDAGDGTGTYTPAEDFNGSETLSCTVSDGDLQDTASISLTVNPVNDAPTANDDEAFIDAATETSVNIDVLANDSDPDFGDTLVVDSVDTTNTQGSVVIESNGILTYTPPANFVGTDAFTYTVEDSGGANDTATVTVWEVLECGETLAVPANEWDVTGEYERLTSTGGCDDGKPYTVDVVGISDEPSVLFQPRPQSGDPVLDCSDEDSKALCLDEFRAELTFEPGTKSSDPDTGTLRYDPVAQSDPTQVVFRDMPWCISDPFADGVLPENRRNVLPTGESWCIVSVSTVIAGAETTATTWITYGIGDPWKIAT